MTGRPIAPGIVVPEGACDTHIHVYGPPDRYPSVSTTPFPVPDAPPAAFQKSMMEGLGIERAVVVDSDTSDEDLQRMTDAGARGVRFHMLPGGVLPWDILEEMAVRVHAFGWHVQLQMDGRDLPERE